jgi:hypothetical protein
MQQSAKELRGWSGPSRDSSSAAGIELQKTPLMGLTPAIRTQAPQIAGSALGGEFEHRCFGQSQSPITQRAGK